MITLKEAALLPIASLAYLGDSVMEIYVREKLVLDGKGNIHKRAAGFVTAKAQSAAADRLIPIFTEAENDIYKRGRNSIHTAPKSATHAEYSRATGLECVFGYLYLSGQNERISELFYIGYPE